MTLLAIFEALVGANAIWETTVRSPHFQFLDRQILICPDPCKISLITVSPLWQDCVASHSSEYMDRQRCARHCKICGSIYSKTWGATHFCFKVVRF